MIYFHFLYGKKNKLGLIVFFLYLNPFFGFSQTPSQNDKFIGIDFQLGASNYAGELSPDDGLFSVDPNFTQWYVGFGLNKKITSRLALRSNFTWLRLKGDDFQTSDFNNDNQQNNYFRNLNFRNDLFELSLTGQWDFFKSLGHFSERRNWTPYLFAGIGLLAHNPMAKTSEEDGNIWVALQPLGTEGQGREGFEDRYGLINLSFPVGLGINFKLTDRIDLGIESGFRLTMTDFLDDVSGNFPNSNIFAENSLARNLSDRSGETIAAITQDIRIPINGVSQIENLQRGDSRNFDRYWLNGFRVKYLLSKNQKKEELSRIHHLNTISTFEIDSLIQPKNSKFDIFKDRYEVKLLGINTEGSDMIPKFYKTGILYVSDKRDRKNFVNRNRGNFYNFFYAPVHDLYKNNITKPVYVKDELYDKMHHYGGTYSYESQQIVISMQENPDNSNEVKHQKLFIANAAGENTWEEIQELPFNHPNHSVSQPSLSRDGKTLYFVSDKEGGYGGTDIYISYQFNGHWTYPINAGNVINTEKDELFPFIHPDGQLYFTSNGHEGMGGLDIFEAVSDSKGNFTSVVNLGTPINSEKDDFSLILDAVKRTGYFTSNRDGGKGGNDIYEIGVLKLSPSRLLTDNQEEELMSMFTLKLKGQVIDKTTKQPVSRAIVKLNDQLRDDLLLTRSDELGYFSFDIRNDGLYEIGSTAKGYKRMENHPLSTIGISKQETLEYVIEMNPVKFTFNIKGKVLNKDTNEPLVGAEVVLLNLYEDKNTTIITELDGSYHFNLERNQNYVIFLLEKGYEQWEVNLSTFNKTASETLLFNIPLKPVSEEEE